MNWSYIAGFFDGEGSINLQPRSCQASFTQVIRKDMVLENIQSFLRSRGVRSGLSSHSGRKGTKWNPTQRLTVSDHCSVVKFLQSVLPYLTVKKEKAEKAIKQLKETDWKNASLIPASRLEVMRRDYWNGMSFVRVEAKYNISNKVLRDYMLSKYCERGRTRSAALRLHYEKAA